MSKVISRRQLIKDPPELVVDGSVIYTMSRWVCVPEDAGVYIISDLRGPLYIGRSVDLRRRFEEHLRGSHNDLLTQSIHRPIGTTYFTWTLCPYREQLSKETALIRTLQPLCNKTNLTY